METNRHLLVHCLPDKMTLLTKLAIAALLVSFISGLSLNERKNVAMSSKSTVERVPLMSLEEGTDSEDDSGLFYASDVNVYPEEKEPEQSLLDTLLLDIMQTNNSTDAEKCQQYKAQINDVCMAKFVQRSRFRPEDVSVEGISGGSLLGKSSPDGKKRLTATLATPQQICCEFRLTYLRCVLSNINFVCPLTEFNSLYGQVEGLSEICSRFFAKSSKKCRKRYRNKTIPAVETTNDANTNTTTPVAA